MSKHKHNAHVIKSMMNETGLDYNSVTSMLNISDPIVFAHEYEAAKNRNMMNMNYNSELEDNCELWCYMTVPPVFRIEKTYMMPGQDPNSIVIGTDEWEGF